MRRWPWVLAALAAAAGGAALAFALRDPVVGKDGSDAVVTATLAAMAAGDVDALVALADPVALYALAVDCYAEAADTDAGTDESAREAAAQAAARQPREVAARERIDWAPLVARTRGQSLAVVEQRDAEPNTVPVGKPIMNGCAAAADLHIHRIRVKLVDGREATIGTVETRGRWFLATPPRL